MPNKRRKFLKLSLAALAGALAIPLLTYKLTSNATQTWFNNNLWLKSLAQSKHRFQGQLLGPSRNWGHKLRDNFFATFLNPQPVQKLKTKVVIVGGGISGLSAANYLAKHGLKANQDDFLLLEMEKNTGGNSSSGENKVSAYPWGAHYVPIPPPEAKYVLELFEELGVIEGYDKNGLPIYNDLYLCHAPEERLLKNGHWQDGLMPQKSLTEKEEKDLKRFFELIEKYKTSQGEDGKPAFTIPLAFSSRDQKFQALDQLSMSAWLKQQSLDSEALNWYVDYCCRDDYGANMSHVSAWAGLHYFASRRGKASNTEANSVLTWPEGNGWLVKKLAELIQGQIQTNILVNKIEEKNGKILVNCIQTATNQPIQIECQQVIYAAPRFLAPYLIPQLKKQNPNYLQKLEYAPWMVANITLKEAPQSSNSEHDAPIAWDNVSFHSRSLGYVVATHQNITTQNNKTVITYYFPLTDQKPSLERQKLLKKNYQAWANEITEDLEKMHPGISTEIENLDVWLWGHGMIQPTVGFLWSQERQEMQKPFGNIHFAHSDMSGISVFEEAQFQGIEAAKKVLAKLT
jgi:protoporphyrinogen oxidase